MKAIIQLSGGLDSTVALAWLISQGHEPYALTFLYGQRHDKEVNQALKIASHYNILGKVASIHFPIDAPLTQETGDLNKEVRGLPASFVPGRNITFLALAAGLAYEKRAKILCGGWNSVDYPGYPDCRPNFLMEMQNALREGLDYPELTILAPLIYLTKAEIIQMGIKLNAPLELTWSCYQGLERPCGSCSSCQFRAEGFAKAGIIDPAI